MYKAHFDTKTALRTHRTFEYGSLTLLAFVPHCTLVQKSVPKSEGNMK